MVKEVELSGMSVRSVKKYKQGLYDLGWYEDDNDEWRCRKCNYARYLRDCCCGCGRCVCDCRCERCKSSKPDTDAGN